jgi:hypothetical protein
MGKSSFTQSGLYKVILFLIVAIGAILGFRAVQFLAQIDSPATKTASVPSSGASTQFGAQSQAKHSIGARIDSFACDGTQWLLVISPLTDQASAPASIHVAWSNGQQEDVPFAGFSDSTASYITQSNLSASILSASAAIYAAWSGEFSLRYGPCPPTATVHPTATSTATIIPPTRPAPVQATRNLQQSSTQQALPTTALTAPAGTQDPTAAAVTPASTPTLAARVFSAVMDGAECATYEWEFVLDGLSSAPRFIHATWEDGAQEDVPLSAFSEGTAYYISTSHLEKKLVWASATLPLDWQGHFNLRHGPCLGGSYAPPATVAPRATTPVTSIAARPPGGTTPQPSVMPPSEPTTASPSETSAAPSPHPSSATPGGPTPGSTFAPATATAIEPISTTTGTPAAETPTMPVASPSASASPSPERPITRAYLARTSAAECDAVEWEFILDGVSNAPRTIDVTWTDGAEENVPLSSFAGGTAYYITTSNLATPLAWASVVLPSDWAGHFELHVGPCLSGATPQAIYPTDTASPAFTPHPTGIPYPTRTPASLEGSTTPHSTDTPAPTYTYLPVSAPDSSKTAGGGSGTPTPDGSLDTPAPTTTSPPNATPTGLVGTPVPPTAIPAGATNPPLTAVATSGLPSATAPISGPNTPLQTTQTPPATRAPHSAGVTQTPAQTGSTEPASTEVSSAPSLTAITLPATPTPSPLADYPDVSSTHTTGSPSTTTQPPSGPTNAPGDTPSPSYTPLVAPVLPSPSQPPPATGTALTFSSPTVPATITSTITSDTPVPTRTPFSEVLPEVGTPTPTQADQATPTEIVPQPTTTPIPALLPATGFLPGLLIVGGAMLAAIGFVSIGLGLLKRRKLKL